MSDPCRLYLITPPHIDDLHAFSEIFKSALGAGDIACVQLRLKSSDGGPVPDDEFLSAAEILLPIAHANDAEFLINDRPGLALQTGADGVHIGQSDTPYDKARKILGDDATIGVTCHNSRHLAIEAGEAGADYVAFGAFFETSTKDVTEHATPAILEWCRYATTMPSVAIGGITPENCAPLVHADADFLAVSSAVWGHVDGPAAAIRAFTKAIKAAGGAR
ncbi:MAG: thiamine-phosphate synthase [Hyphococcus sp.]|nr:MAG: thiamine-phosphate synthase [Marinicaulis sp.]